MFTSTTSTFGDALTPPRGAPAAWITEDVVPIPKNIYGATKVAAEDLCQLFHRNQQLPCLVLRTSRFFPEEDDVPERRAAFEDANLKANEFLYRRVDVEDVVSAHLLAWSRRRELGFGKFIITATTPFTRDDVARARPRCARGAAAHGSRIRGHLRHAGLEDAAGARPRLCTTTARATLLGWKPRYDFAARAAQRVGGHSIRAASSRAIGSKGYQPG